MTRLVLAIAACVVVAACDGAPAAPDSSLDLANDGLITGDAWHAGAGPGAMPLRVFQQNVYPGFSIDAVEAALGSGNPVLAVQALTNGLLVFEQTNWRERAAAMALEIQRQDPDVVNLQEMVTIGRQGFSDVAPMLAGTPLAGLGPYWAMIPNGTVEFLPLFMEELDKLGLHYTLVRQLDLTDITVPIAYPPYLPEGIVWARYADADVMLVRTGLAVSNASTHVYDVGLMSAVGYQTRGWIAADVAVAGKTWRVVGTHPAPNWTPGPGETPQITELLASLADSPHPVVITGDLNFLPTDPQWTQLHGAGYEDLWGFRRDAATNPGYTCCRQVETLDQPLADDPLTERKDYVWVKPAAGYEVGPVKFLLFGDEPTERTVHGLWPSDHLGLPVGVVVQKAK